MVRTGFSRRSGGTGISLGKLAGIVAIIIVLAITGFEWFVLRGEVIDRQSTSISSSEPVTIRIDRVDEKHTFELRPYRETSLKWSIQDPAGNTIYSDSEITASKKNRLYSFVPSAAGEYRVFVGRPMLSSRATTVAVRVLVNDRRIFSRLFYFLRF